MGADKIHTLLKQNFNYQPTSGQEQLIRKLSDFISSDDAYPLFVVKGYAGTGKTPVFRLSCFRRKRFS